MSSKSPRSIPSEGQDRHSGVHPHVIQMEAHQAHSYQINSTYHIYIYMCENMLVQMLDVVSSLYKQCLY